MKVTWFGKPTNLHAVWDSMLAEDEHLSFTKLAPKPAWTSAKMDPAKLDAMLRAIVGFAISAPTFSGTVKMGQNKSDAEAAGAIGALRARGDDVAADAMEGAR